MQVKEENYVKKPFHVSKYISEISDRGILNALRAFLPSKWIQYREERLIFKWEESLILHATSKKHTKPTLHTQPHIIRTVLPSQDSRSRVLYSDGLSKTINPNSELSFFYLFSTFNCQPSNLTFSPLCLYLIHW